MTNINHPTIVMKNKEDFAPKGNLMYPGDLFSDEENRFLEIRILEMESISLDEVEPEKTIQLIRNPMTNYLSSIFLYIPGDSLKTSYNQAFNDGTIESLRGKAVSGYLQEKIPGALRAIEEKYIESFATTIGFESSRLQNKVNAISNPRLELEYIQPTLRTHSFNFKFLPKNEKETNTVNEIIKRLKLANHPELTGNGAFFRKPNVVEINYMNNTEYLFKIGQSYIESIAVDYAGEGVPSFFENNAPTSITLSFDIKEINILTKEEINQGY